MTKIKYFILFFLIWYFFNGLALTFVFKKSDIKDKKDPGSINCNDDDRNALEKCGGPICPAGCFYPEVSNLGFFVHPDSYKYTFIWPVWLVDEFVWPEVYNPAVGTYSRKFFGRHT